MDILDEWQFLSTCEQIARIDWRGRYSNLWRESWPAPAQRWSSSIIALISLHIEISTETRSRLATSSFTTVLLYIRSCAVLLYNAHYLLKRILLSRSILEQVRS